MVVANATSRAWDRRDDETLSQYRRFVQWLDLGRRDRAAALASSGRDRTYFRQHDWALRAAAYDDNRDREYEQARADAVREMRDRHAQVGRALLTFAVAKLRAVDIVKPADLIKLADLARRMEQTALLGAEADVSSTSRDAVTAAHLPVDEWDRLAAELAATIPSRPS